MTDDSNPDIYRSVDVPDQLKPFVRRILVADIEQPVDFAVAVPATGYHYFGWIWRGRWQGIANGKTVFDNKIDGPFHLSGQVEKSEIRARFSGQIGNIFLEFSALGHYELLGVPGEVVLEDAKAPQLFSPALESGLAPLLHVGDLSVDQRLELLSDHLARLPKHAVPAGLAAGLAKIEAADGNIRIADMLNELGLAERQFRAEFKKLVGLSPKVFCKTLQINKTLNQLLEKNRGDLADIAAQSGFADQAHFTRAFGKFLGRSPRSYAEDIEVTVARFAGQSRKQ